MSRARRHAGRLLVGVAALALGVRAAHAQTRRALLIGINHYEYAAPVLASWQRHVEPAVAAWRARLQGSAPATAARLTGEAAPHRQLVGDLDGAVNDATAIAEVLQHRYQFAPPRLLLNEHATRDSILAALRQLADDARPGDVVVFYYAGHGSQRVNSLSTRKLNHLDQTIVPADANAGQFDIRDMELAAAFDRVLDRIGPTGTLTLIFDSCHSGAVTRGEPSPSKVRWAAADPRDAADSVAVPPPEDRGALFLAAAQDFEPSSEVTASDVEGRPRAHGAFTAALLRVMRSAPPNEPAMRVFERARAILQQDGLAQNPVIRGTESDRRRPLFGTYHGALAGGVTAPVLRVEHDTVRLQAGLAVGLAPGTELRLVDSAPNAPMRLKVVALRGLAESDAVAIAGSARRLSPGTLFVVDRWTSASGPALRVWIPPGRETAALTRDVAALGALRHGSVVEWADDPTTLPDDGRPLYVVRYEQDGWHLVTPAGATMRLAAATADEVGRAIAAAESAATSVREHQRTALRAAGAQADGVLPPAGVRPRVAVLVPPPAPLRTGLRLGRGTPNDAVEPVDDPAAADYLLAGRLGDGGVSYAWLRPNGSAASQRRSSLPPRTLWVGSGALDVAADSLTEFATRLARLRGWLTLAAPPDTGESRFPYRLVLRNRATGALRDSGETYDGESYDLVLQRDSTIPVDRIPARWVYVLAIDSYGRGTPLFPSAGLGGNRVPMDSAGTDIAPPVITLPRRAPIRIVPPYGVDTFILLTTAEPIDPEVLRFDGVRGASSDAAGGPLSQLVARVGRTRGVDDDPVPSSWSVQRLALRSGPATTTKP